MTAPRIVAVRRVSPHSSEGQRDILAVLTVEDGPWIVAGFMLMTGHNGKPYLRPPRCMGADARVTLRNFPGRDALLAEALRLTAQFAEPPVATASDSTETFA